MANIISTSSPVLSYNVDSEIPVGSSILISAERKQIIIMQINIEMSKGNFTIYDKEGVKIPLMSGMMGGSSNETINGKIVLSPGADLLIDASEGGYLKAHILAILI